MIELMHNVGNSEGDKEKRVTYVAALFICKTIQPIDIINYINTYQPIIPYSETFEKFENLHKQNDDDEL